MRKTSPHLVSIPCLCLICEKTGLTADVLQYFSPSLLGGEYGTWVTWAASIAMPITALETFLHVMPWTARSIVWIGTSYLRAHQIICEASDAFWLKLEQPIAEIYTSLLRRLLTVAERRTLPADEIVSD